MPESNKYLQCPQCGYPVRYASPTSLMYDQCPMCETDLGEKFEEQEQRIQDERIYAFLKEFYNPPKLVTVKELEEFLRSDKSTIWKMIENNDLKAIDVSPSESERRMLRFQPYHILDFLEERDTAH